MILIMHKLSGLSSFAFKIKVKDLTEGGRNATGHLH